MFTTKEKNNKYLKIIKLNKRKNVMEKIFKLKNLTLKNNNYLKKNI